MQLLCERSPSELLLQLELSGLDVRVKLLDVHDSDGLEDGDIERGCLKG